MLLEVFSKLVDIHDIVVEEVNRTDNDSIFNIYNFLVNVISVTQDTTLNLLKAINLLLATLDVLVN